MTYTQRVRDSILPLSVADILPQAFEEWRFTGHTQDHEEPIETCRLCGQEGLRYHFEIQNDFTHRTLDVGSHCILQFNVAVYEDGRRLSSRDAKRRLHKLVQKMRLDSCIGALERLARAESSQVLLGALTYYRTNKKLTPKQAFVVFWRLRRNRIDHDASFFNVTLRKKRYMADLAAMETSKVHFFWRALTPGQRRNAISLGHSAPPGQ
jgi:hypothetical protein